MEKLNITIFSYQEMAEGFGPMKPSNRPFFNECMTLYRLSYYLGTVLIPTEGKNIRFYLSER
jgi:hypothetical protein